MNLAANNINRKNNQFSLPQGAHAYIGEITERCVDLIDARYLGWHPRTTIATLVK